MTDIINYFRRHRFCLNPHDSPTYVNLNLYLKKLGWESTRMAWRAQFDAAHFSLPNDVAECLEYKDQLARLVLQYCPEVMPFTYYIDDHNWVTILNHLADTKNPCAWILKPATLNNGQHIHLFNHPNHIEQHYLSANRLGGPHVLQQYIADPHLLKGPSAGHKYSIRMFVVVTNYAGVYLYHQGYFNIALHPYQPHEFNDQHSHLTNEHLTADASNVIQIPTQRYDLFTPFYPQIKSILKKITHGLHDSYPHAFQSNQKRTVGLFGFDFMVDANGRVWLLEANHGPCFPTDESHPLQASLYHDFWQAVIASFVIPIAEHTPTDCIEYRLFERMSCM